MTEFIVNLGFAAVFALALHWLGAPAWAVVMFIMIALPLWNTQDIVRRGEQA